MSFCSTRAREANPCLVRKDDSRQAYPSIVESCVPSVIGVNRAIEVQVTVRWRDVAKDVGVVVGVEIQMVPRSIQMIQSPADGARQAQYEQT